MIKKWSSTYLSISNNNDSILTFIYHFILITITLIHLIASKHCIPCCMSSRTCEWMFFIVQLDIWTLDLKHVVKISITYLKNVFYLSLPWETLAILLMSPYLEAFGVICVCIGGSNPLLLWKTLTEVRWISWSGSFQSTFDFFWTTGPWRPKPIMVRGIIPCSSKVSMMC